MSSFGETLRRERELRGVSLREIADATNISVRFLQALEKDRLDILPGGVFRRAFVKQYAKHLGLDAERLVAEFVYAHGEQLPREPQPSRRREGANPGTLLLIAVFATVAVLSLWKATPVREPEPAPVPVARSLPRAPEPVARLPAETLAVAAPEKLVLTLHAHDTCWVEVRVDGHSVLNRVLAQGQSETFEAQGEIVLALGNAGGVSFSVNERAGRPLGKSGEVRRNIVITKQNLPSFVEESPQLRASHSS
jgi:cytoskeletal protein RodZ